MPTRDRELADLRAAVELAEAELAEARAAHRRDASPRATSLVTEPAPHLAGLDPLAGLDVERRRVQLRRAEALADAARHRLAAAAWRAHVADLPSIGSAAAELAAAAGPLVLAAGTEILPGSMPSREIDPWTASIAGPSPSVPTRLALARGVVTNTSAHVITRCLREIGDAIERARLGAEEQIERHDRLAGEHERAAAALHRRCETIEAQRSGFLGAVAAAVADGAHPPEAA